LGLSLAFTMPAGSASHDTDNFAGPRAIRAHDGVRSKGKTSEQLYAWATAPSITSSAGNVAADSGAARIVTNIAEAAGRDVSKMI
jgi:hypothetical protein